MNSYAVIILAALIFDYLLNLIADRLNLKALQGSVPPEMEGIYEPARYQQSQDYTRMTTQLGILSSTLTLGVTLLFWFSGGFNILNQWILGWGLGVLPSGLAFIGILALLRGLLSLPFSLYSTFVIEERFGFNRTTPRVFFSDLAKSVLLSVLFGAPLLAALLGLFEFAGSHAWILAWMVATAFIFFVQFITPTWIMPLFNKFKPLDEGDLRERIFSYARSVEFPIENVFVIDGSRRSSKSNAFFTGFGKHKRIAFFDTLIAKHSVPELVAVLAHEIGHYKKGHIVQGMIVSILHLGLMLFLLSFLIGQPGLYEAFFMKNRPLYAGFIFFSMLLIPLEFLLGLFLQMLSRHNEYAADRFAAETIESPEFMIAALKKLSSHNLSNLTPHPLYALLNYSHPPVLQRVLAIRRSAADARRA